MSGVITFPFHVGDFLSGTLHMDTLEKGAYIMLILAHMQAGEEGLPNDDKKLSRIAGVSPKVWSRIKDIIAEKFTITDSFWVQKKCVEVLRKIHEISAVQRSKSLKRHNTGNATAKPRDTQPKTKNQKPKTIKKKEVGGDILKAMEKYNLIAEKFKLPIAQTLTDTRRAKLEHRLTSCGGMEGWQCAMEKLEQSNFLLGENDKGWKADFDFILQEKSFTKLMEGAYDSKKRNKTNSINEQVRELEANGW